VDDQDVRMLDRGQHRGFPPQHLRVHRGDVGLEPLDRDAAAGMSRSSAR
jgi:hypothetical protein